MLMPIHTAAYAVQGPFMQVRHCRMSGGQDKGGRAVKGCRRRHVWAARASTRHDDISAGQRSRTLRNASLCHPMHTTCPTDHLHLLILDFFRLVLDLRDRLGTRSLCQRGRQGRSGGSWRHGGVGPSSSGPRNALGRDRCGRASDGRSGRRGCGRGGR